MYERRAERPREREVLRLQLVRCPGVVIDPRLQPPAAAAGVEIDQRIDVVQNVFRDLSRNHLRRVAAGVARVNLVEIGASMLLGRKTAEPRSRHGIRDRDDNEAALERRSIEAAQEFTDRHRRQEFIAVRVGDDSECRSRMRPGDDVQRHAQGRTVQHVVTSMRAK